MRNVNLYESLLSCSIHPYIQLHNSALRPGAHGLHDENWIWKVMETEEKELDKQMWWSWAILIKN